MRMLLLSALASLGAALPVFGDDPLPRKGPRRMEGAIAEKDPVMKFEVAKNSVREMRAKPYDLPFAAGRTYTISLNAAEKTDNLDPFLVVQDSAGKILAHDDDSGGGRNAWLTLRVPKTGTYRIYAGTLRGSGGFTLTVSEANVVRQGFPAAKADSADLTKSDTAWEIEWEIARPDNSGNKRSTPASVLLIRSARFMFKDDKGEPRWFSVLKNLEIGEILVPYDHMRPVFLDVSEHAFQILPAKKEYLGPTCVAAGEILDSHDERMHQRVHKEVHDDGLRWVNAEQKARRGEKMLLWALFDGGNYRYILEYGFNDDGVITCRLGATAHNLFDKQADGRDVHLHVGCWRWDPDLCEEAPDSSKPDIGGASKNRILLVRRVPRTPAPNGMFKIDIAPFSADDKGRACEGFADWKPEEFTMLRVESKVRKNGSKNPRFTAYDVVPVRVGAVRNYPGKYAFANHDFWVTNRRGPNAKYSEVPLHATFSNSLDGMPCTIWHNSPALHVPRGEDYGIDGVTRSSGAAITSWAGFIFRPVNLFDRTPLYP